MGLLHTTNACRANWQPCQDKEPGDLIFPDCPILNANLLKLRARLTSM
jgi:hypothetical protein